MMYEYTATIINVVDGDTVDLEIDLGFRSYIRDRFRLLGINTPERGQTGYAEAKAYVGYYLGQTVRVKTHKDEREKYGRWLAEIYTIESVFSVNQRLVQNNLAVPYDGGRR